MKCKLSTEGKDKREKIREGISTTTTGVEWQHDDRVDRI